MPDDAERTAMDNMSKIIEESSKEFDEAQKDSDDSNDDSYDFSEDSTADSAPDSDDLEEEDSDEDSDDGKPKKEDSDDSDKEDSDDPDFGFRDTPANIKSFVEKFKAMTPEEKKARIASLDPVRNKAELAAVKDLIPSNYATETKKFEVDQEEWKAMQEKLEKLEKLENSEKFLETYEKLQKKQPELEAELANRMLKDKYGERFEEVSSDPKFQAALEQYGKLDLADRLEAASMHSKVAREILIGQKAVDLNKAKALAKRKKSSSSSTGKKEFKHSILTEEGIQERFGDELGAI